MEYGEPPYSILNVRPDWLTQVVRRDHVVLDWFPVLDVLDHDHRGRPTAVQVAVVGGWFDTNLHGWRAHAHTYDAEVGWDGDTPTVAPGERV